MIGLYKVVILALATAAISVTISKAAIFHPLREWISRRSNWFGELINCHYCTSHWVAIALVAVYQPRVVERWILVDLVVSLFVVVALAAIVSGVIIALTTLPSKVRMQEDDVRGGVGSNSTR